MRDFGIHLLSGRDLSRHGFQPAASSKNLPTGIPPAPKPYFTGSHASIAGIEFVWCVGERSDSFPKIKNRLFCIRYATLQFIHEGKQAKSVPHWCWKTEEFTDLLPSQGVENERIRQHDPAVCYVWKCNAFCRKCQESVSRLFILCIINDLEIFLPCRSHVIYFPPPIRKGVLLKPFLRADRPKIHTQKSIMLPAYRVDSISGDDGQFPFDGCSVFVNACLPNSFGTKWEYPSWLRQEYRFLPNVWSVFIFIKTIQAVICKVVV